MKNFTKIILILAFVPVACEVEGVKSDSKQENKEVRSESQENETPKDTVEHVEKESIPDTLSKKLETPEEEVFVNGVKITWKSRGEGRKINKNDMVNIDYRVSLEDGTIYDGNHLVKKPYIPFYVGWNLQTEGWDFAFQKLREGDDVEIFLPAKLARGEKGIPGVVPPNSNNIISVKIVGIQEPTKVVDDIKIWRVEEAKQKENGKDTIGFEDQVAMHYWVSSESNPRYDNSYQRGEPFELTMGDGNIVPGLYKALHFAKKGDKLMIHIPAKEAYGKKGLPKFVKPNEDIFYDVFIVDVF